MFYETAIYLNKGEQNEYLYRFTNQEYHILAEYDKVFPQQKKNDKSKLISHKKSNIFIKIEYNPYDDISNDTIILKYVTAINNARLIYNKAKYEESKQSKTTPIVDPVEYVVQITVNRTTKNTIKKVTKIKLEKKEQNIEYKIDEVHHSDSNKESKLYLALEYKLEKESKFYYSTNNAIFYTYLDTIATDSKSHDGKVLWLKYIGYKSSVNNKTTYYLTRKQFKELIKSNAITLTNNSDNTCELTIPNMIDIESIDTIDGRAYEIKDTDIKTIGMNSTEIITKIATLPQKCFTSIPEKTMYDADSKPLKLSIPKKTKYDSLSNKKLYTYYEKDLIPLQDKINIKFELGNYMKDQFHNIFKKGIKPDALTPIILIIFAITNEIIRLNYDLLSNDLNHLPKYYFEYIYYYPIELVITIESNKIIAITGVLYNGGNDEIGIELWNIDFYANIYNYDENDQYSIEKYIPDDEKYVKDMDLYNKIFLFDGKQNDFTKLLTSNKYVETLEPDYNDSSLVLFMCNEITHPNSTNKFYQNVLYTDYENSEDAYTNGFLKRREVREVIVSDSEGSGYYKEYLTENHNIWLKRLYRYANHQISQDSKFDLRSFINAINGKFQYNDWRNLATPIKYY
jgi:hypothetical protein